MFVGYSSVSFASDTLSDSNASSQEKFCLVEREKDGLCTKERFSKYLVGGKIRWIREYCSFYSTQASSGGLSAGLLRTYGLLSGEAAGRCWPNCPKDEQMLEQSEQAYHEKIAELKKSGAFPEVAFPEVVRPDDENQSVKTEKDAQNSFFKMSNLTWQHCLPFVILTSAVALKLMYDYSSPDVAEHEKDDEENEHDKEKVPATKKLLKKKPLKN